jgi:hypothetical protein
LTVVTAQNVEVHEGTVLQVNNKFCKWFIS